MEAHFNSSHSSSDDLTELILASVMTILAACCVFIINLIILVLLRSKPMFSQCPRYVLLFNLVLADTLLIALSQILYLLANFKIHISYPLCGCLAMMSRLCSQISPLTLIFMSLERCVAVCFPFRHSTLVTLRNTHFAILLIWTVAGFHILTQVVLLLEFHKFTDLQITVICRIMTMSVGPTFQANETIYTYALFSLSASIILGSFVAVTVIACLATGDKAQLEKTRYTLLLHLFQLGMNLLSVMNMQIFLVVVRCCRSKQLLDVVYVCVVLMPRCLSALTYSLRDPVIRPALGSRLWCTLWLQVRSVQMQVLKNRHRRSPNSGTRWQ